MTTNEALQDLFASYAQALMRELYKLLGSGNGTQGHDEWLAKVELSPGN